MYSYSICRAEIEQKYQDIMKMTQILTFYGQVSQYNLAFLEHCELWEWYQITHLIQDESLTIDNVFLFEWLKIPKSKK